MNKLNRPYIICHMTTSINGKITGEYLDKNVECVNEYYRIHKEFNADGFLCGRITMESSFTQGYYPNLDKYQDYKVERYDYVAGNYDFYAIAIDFHAKLGWINNHIIDDDPGYNNAHIIEILSENVSDSFLAYLRENKISYILAGKEILDLKLAMRKLKELFNINLLLLESGGIIDGSFLKDELVDELSLVIAPSIEYSKNTKELFFNDNHLLKQFSLVSIEKIIGNGLWLRYKCN